MDLKEILSLIVTQIENQPAVEGSFAVGSLINQDQDAFSDIDLGIASGNCAEDLERAYALKAQIMAAIGTPVHFIERGWNNCKMVAALYGKSKFPPVGLEVDLVFSQVKHAHEQMPYAKYEIVFDRNGELKRVLEQMGQKRPTDEAVDEIKPYMRGYPFMVHDALKAHARGDLFQFQSLLEAMRSGIFCVGAIRHGKQVYGSKRAFKHLSVSEQQVVEGTYRAFSRSAVEELVELFMECLDGVPTDYEIGQDVEHLRRILRQLL